MISFKRLTLAILLLNTSSEARKLSYKKIAGFEPQSVVSDVNDIDLDYVDIEAQLALGTKDSYLAAQRIYEEGGHSMSYATLSIVGGLPFTVTKGEKMTGKSSAGANVYGVALEDGSSGALALKFQYVQETATKCQVGGLVTPNLEGCLGSNGTVTVDGSTTAVSYTYSPETDNNNDLSLKSLSITAETAMKGGASSEYYPDFQLFVDYYGTQFYADEFITAALSGTATSFTNGNADFTNYDFAGRTEAVEKGIQYLSIAMYSIRQMELALDSCDATCSAGGCDDVNNLDEAVAYYSGSLEGEDGSGSGVLMYSLADKRCVDFKTCGETANELTGISRVNLNVISLFKKMQQHLQNNKCEAARDNKEAIVRQMIVPLIQGTIRYARITESVPDSNSDDKAESEGASFAAAVLPFVYKCSPTAATTIYDNMKTGQGKTAKLVTVKQAFESTYDCLGVTCGDVGGVWDDANNNYFAGGEPCKGRAATISSSVRYGITFVPILALFLPVALALL